MAMPSLSQARDVVTTFIAKMAKDGEKGSPSIESDPGPTLSRKLFRLLRKAFGQEARERMVLNKDLQNYVENFPEYLIRFTSEQISNNLARKLNHSLGVQTHILSKVDKRGRKYPVVRFTAPKLNPKDLYRRFAVRLRDEEGLDVTPEQLKQMVKTQGTYAIESRDRPVYDQDELKATSSVQRGKAISTLVDALDEMIMDPSKFLHAVGKQSEMTEEKAEAIETQREMLPTATAWMRPPAGKTTSGTEEEKAPGGRRPMDPRVERLFDEAMRDRRIVPWRYKAVRTEGGKSGTAFNMLDFTLPDLGEKTYSIRIPDDIAKAVEDQREGESNHFEVVGKDDSKGFKVKFKEQLEGLRKSTAKATAEAGVDHQALDAALRRSVIEHVNDLVRPDRMGDVAEVVRDVLGKVIVGGKDISSPGGLSDLAEETERRLTVEDPRGRPGKDDKGPDAYEVYKEQKREERERAEEHEKAVGPEISKAMAKGDPTVKVMDKLADMIARDFPEKASFDLLNVSGWKMANAFQTKDTIRWLVRTMVDYAMQPTEKGAIRWGDFLKRLFESRDLASPEVARLLTGGRDVDDLMMAMKLVMEAQSGRLSIAKGDPQKKEKMEERRSLLNDYHNNRLTVTPQERQQIVDAIASKGAEAMRKFVAVIQNRVKQAFVRLYQSGDPDAERIVNMAHVDTREPVTKQEKEERGLETKKRIKRESLRPQMEALRQKREQEEAASLEVVRDLERMLVDRKFEEAGEVLKQRKAPARSVKKVQELSGLDYSSPSAPDYEKAMETIESISNDLESALAAGAPKKRGRKKKVEEAPAEKEAMYLQVVRMAMMNAFGN